MNSSTKLMNLIATGKSQKALDFIASGKSEPGRIAPNGLTALIQACSSRMPEVALKLIETGEAKPGYVVPENGFTALSVACLSGLTEVAIALIDTGEVDILHKDNRGRSSLAIAKQRGLTEVVERMDQELRIKPNTELMVRTMEVGRKNQTTELPDDVSRHITSFLITPKNGGKSKRKQRHKKRNTARNKNGRNKKRKSIRR